MLDYYKDLLGKAPLHRQSIDSSIITQGAVLSQDQQIDLYKPFSDLDIEETLFSIPNHKWPGPDGYSSGFFKSSWNTIGPLVCAIVRQFLQTRHMPLFLSNTKLILLPKVPHPKNASDFRPFLTAMYYTRSSPNYCAPESRWSFLTLSAKAKERSSKVCLLYTSPSPRDGLLSRMPSSA